MKSLLEEFDDIIVKYGHDVLLLRKNKNKRCSCYDQKTQSADRDCPFCFGLSYIPIIEKHKIRELDTGVPQTLPLLDSKSSFGAIAIPARAYFFRRNDTISEQDLIIDVDWDGDTPMYTRKGIYEISHIDPQRFEQGEEIFKKVYVKDQPIEKSIRGFRIVEEAGKIFYEMAENKKG